MFIVSYLLAGFDLFILLPRHSFARCFDERNSSMYNVVFVKGRRRVRHGKLYIFCNFSVSQCFFFPFNLRLLQLSVSFFGNFGTLKKSIRTIPDETLRVICSIIAGKENETFGYLLYYESFK